MWFKECFWETQCRYCVQWERQKKCDSKKKIEKHNAYIVCNHKMAMQCRQVSTDEHEGERWNSWVQSAKLSAAVRGQVGREATVAGRHLPGVTELNVGIFWLPVLWLIVSRAASRGCCASSFMCATHLSCCISFLDFSVRIFQECHTT
jgi:hypothetical protein